MLRARPMLATAIMLFVVANLLTAPTHAIELSGAWASQGDLYKLVVTNKGNAVAFTELSDLYASGSIIDGNRIRGKAARCTITSRKQRYARMQIARSAS